jgi:twitching motility protein PilI
MAEQQAAFQALVDLADRSRRTAKGLPAQVDIKPHWSGIGFSLLGRHFVVPMGEVSEMLEVPHYTRLPGVQPWVKGVANVRGRLLPVLDMGLFFGQRLTGHRKNQRVLILETENLYSGLMVDQVFGMQHFPMDTYKPASGNEDAQLEALVSGSYELDGKPWSVFSLAVLAENPRFVNAAQGN